jgi:hypothetical protein
MVKKPRERLSGRCEERSDEAISLIGRGERSLGNKWGQAPFSVLGLNRIFLIYSPGQKQRVFEPNSLSLFFLFFLKKKNIILYLSIG